MSPVHLVIAGMVAPAVVVFLLVYRHALVHWLSPIGAELPRATVLGERRRPRFGAWRHVHAVFIAVAFMSVTIMAMVPVMIFSMMLAS